MYPGVPHHRLPRLHAFLSEVPEYAEKGVVVAGHLVPASGRKLRNPTVIEVLGPEYGRRTGEVFVDDSVLEGWEVVEERILEQGEAERRKGAAAGET